MSSVNDIIEAYRQGLRDGRSSSESTCSGTTPDNRSRSVFGVPAGTCENIVFDLAKRLGGGGQTNFAKVTMLNTLRDVLRETLHEVKED